MGVKPEQVDEEIAMQYIQRTMLMGGSGGSSGVRTFNPESGTLTN
jgi:hypothetical protein